MNVSETVPGETMASSGSWNCSIDTGPTMGTGWTATGAGPGFIDATTTGPMRAFLAHVDGVAAGICLIAICPASLTLGEFWMVRDLFVDPRWRCTGVARSLLDAVCAAALQRGALRLTLQTEDDNAVALRLYEQYGFGPVTGLRHLTLDLALTDRATE
jgi:GNAT superfamily N-acetyltransferase